MTPKKQQSEPVKTPPIGQNKKLDLANVGLILKAKRENDLEESQRDMANKLGYANSNYVSMVERGMTTISLQKVREVIEAYQLPDELALAILKAGYPELFDAIVWLSGIAHGKTPQEISDRIQDLVDDLAKDLGVTPIVTNLPDGFDLPIKR